MKRTRFSVTIDPIRDRMRPVKSQAKISSVITLNGRIFCVRATMSVTHSILCSDYETIDELDRYEAGGIDDDDENDVDMTVEQRRRAERDIKRREREKRRRLGQELNDESDLDDDEELIGLSSKGKRSRLNDDDVGMDDDVS